MTRDVLEFDDVLAQLDEAIHDVLQDVEHVECSSDAHDRTVDLVIALRIDDAKHREQAIDAVAQLRHRFMADVAINYRFGRAPEAHGVVPTPRSHVSRRRAV